MKQKIVSISIAVIAVLATIFAVVFAMRFNDDKKLLYKDIAVIEQNNPALIKLVMNEKEFIYGFKT